MCITRVKLQSIKRVLENLLDLIYSHLYNFTQGKKPYVMPLSPCLCTKTLTKLYPGADYCHRDIINLLQVVLYVIFGHSVETH